MIQNIFKWRRYRVKHRAMEAAKICLSFLLVPLLLLSLGLASLPEEIWRPKLAIPPSVLASSVTSVEQPEEVFASE